MEPYTSNSEVGPGVLERILLAPYRGLRMVKDVTGGWSSLICVAWPCPSGGPVNGGVADVGDLG